MTPTEKRRRYVWIVEMKVGRKWETTVGAGLNRVGARRELAEWREANPWDKFRLVKYCAADAAARKRRKK